MTEGSASTESGFASSNADALSSEPPKSRGMTRMPLWFMAKLCPNQGDIQTETNRVSRNGTNKERQMHWDPDMKKKHKELFKNQPPRYISLDALVTSKPRHECSLFHDEIREEVVVTGILYNGNSADTYIIRFVHKNCLEQAKTLVPGTRIRIEKGRYDHRQGRLGAEFQVKRFSLAVAALSMSEQPTSNSRKTLELVFDMVWKIEVCQ